MEGKLIRDGHIHSPYCPHGSQDVYEQYFQKNLNGKSLGLSEKTSAAEAFRPYADKAIERGLQEISFTEHMPFPCYFLDDHDYQDCCAPSRRVMPNYFSDVRSVAEAYRQRLVIHTGLEVDYLDGYEEETASLLDQYGPELDDGILSVHFMKIGDELCDIDIRDGFEAARNLLGGTEAVYDRYYETLLKALRADLGRYKPKRIGHPDIIRMFRELYPITYRNYGLLEEIAAEMKRAGYAVDANTTGLRKPYCHELYVSGYLKELVEKSHIPVVYGSDAHRPDDVGWGFELFSAP